MQPISLCDICRHLDFKKTVKQIVYYCNAYPDRVPKEILTGEVDHHKPYNGDHGIRFELKMSVVKAAGFPLKGGPGSGNFGHEGRPGEGVGGSGSGGGGTSGYVVGNYYAAKESFNEYYRGLSDEQKQTLEDYTDGNYDLINDSVRGRLLENNPGLASTEREEIPKDAERMKQIFDNAPKYEGRVYRGAMISQDRFAQLQSLEKGDKITMSGFTSTSTSKDTGREFAPPMSDNKYLTGVLYTIDKGRGIAVEGVSKMPEEKEIVLPDKGEYKVLSVEQPEGLYFLNVHLQMV